VIGATEASHQQPGASPGRPYGHDQAQGGNNEVHWRLADEFHTHVLPLRHLPRIDRLGAEIGREERYGQQLSASGQVLDLISVRPAFQRGIVCQAFFTPGHKTAFLSAGPGKLFIGKSLKILYKG
jgi:uncharacterized membrane-anchored protein